MHVMMQTADFPAVPAGWFQVCQCVGNVEVGAMAKPARQLEYLALQAVAAVDPVEAEGVWMVAFERLTALGSSSKRLIQALVQRLTGVRKGPLRVSPPSFQPLLCVYNPLVWSQGCTLHGGVTALLMNSRGIACL